MTQSILSQNVTALRKHLKLNQASFAEMLGSDQPNVSKWETKNVTPGSSFLSKMAELAGCSAAAFIDNAWSPETTKQASPQNVQEGRRVAAGHSSRSPEQPMVHTADAGEVVGILQLDLSLSMGPGRDIEEFAESDIVGFDASVLRRITRTPSDRLRFVTGIGTSHEPKFQSGDQFLIDINERSISRIDGYYWITFEGSHGLKRLRPVSGGRVLIMSDNKEDYPPYEVDARELRIEGRAIWFARGL
jgi:phage repressor protein C with HTH and peptisase S24 domain